MKRRIWAQRLRVILCVCWLGIWGCGEDPQQIFDTAQFEEKQGNQVHAIELYEHIIQVSPDSDWAKMASERLAVLKK